MAFKVVYRFLNIVKSLVVIEMSEFVFRTR
jgi:hypothetical protein